MRINCPHCGLRSIEEFAILGDATVKRPNEQSNQDAFHDYVYVRDNPKGSHSEYWHHAGGCRAWLVVERNVVSHEIFSVRVVKRSEGEL